MPIEYGSRSGGGGGTPGVSKVKFYSFDLGTQNVVAGQTLNFGASDATITAGCVATASFSFQFNPGIVLAQLFVRNGIGIQGQIQNTDFINAIDVDCAGVIAVFFPSS